MSYFPGNNTVISLMKKWKVPFLSTIILGFLVHAFVFTNRMPNWDAMRNFYSPEQMDSSGRFFLTYANGISSYFELPWLTGALSIVYLAVIAVMIVECLDIKSAITKVLVSALVVTIPSVTATFAYLYTADGYLLATMLTMIALVITKEFKYGWLVASFLILFAVGVYQANLAVALSFIVLYITYLIIFKRQSLKSTAMQAVRMVSPVVIGMILYLIVYKLKTALGTVEISSYKGLDEVGSLTLSDIPERVKYVITYTMDYFFSGEFITNWNLYEAMNAILCVLLLGIVVYAFVTFSNKLYILPVLVLFVSYPFIMFILTFTSPSVDYHTIMTFSTIIIYLLPVLFMDHLLPLKATSMRKVMVYFGLAFTVVVTFNFAINSNIAYMSMEYRTEKTINLLNRIAVSIEENPAYMDAKYMHVIGSPKLDKTPFEEKMKEKAYFIQGTTGRHALSGNVQIVNGLQNYIGMDFDRAKYENKQQLNQNKKVQNMATWPHEDSMLLIDDTLIIKFP